MRVALVGCGKEKRGYAAPARDLYTGPLFCAARTWAETFADRWFILSAQHGLLSPETVIEPYDLKLSALTREAREAWGEWTGAQVAAEVSDDPDETVVAFAGGEYLDTLRHHGSGHWRWRVRDPLEGLELGHRLAWFKRAMVAGRALQRMRAAEAEGAFGRCELSAADCSALFGMGMTGRFDPLGIYALDAAPDEPERVGRGVQLALLSEAA